MWWKVAIGVVATAIGVVTDVLSDLRVPISVWVTAAIGALVAAQFAAFRRLHVDLASRVTDARSTIAELEAEARTPYQFAMSPLSTSFDLHTFKHPLDSSQPGLALRCIVGSVWDLDDQLEVPDILKTELRERVSTFLEELLTDGLQNPNEQIWHFKDPTGQWVLTLARERTDMGDTGLELDAEFLFQVPYPGPRRSWIASVSDVAFRSQRESFSHVWDLVSFRDFVFKLAHATAQLHTYSISQIASEGRSLVGPVVALAAHNARLQDFIQYPPWDRARGVSGASYMTMDSREKDRVTSSPELRAFLESELRAHMSREGFVGFEEELDKLLKS